MGGGFDAMFTIIPVLVGIVFVIVIVSLVMRGANYVKNTNSPRESIFVRVVAKRMEVRSTANHHHEGGGAMHTSRTYYYITLEFDNGERKEYLDVKNLYGLVVEGDQGYASIQGDWVVAFTRSMDPNGQ